MRNLEHGLLPCRGGVLIRRIALNLRTSESETAGKWLIHSHTRGKRRGGLMMILAVSKEKNRGVVARVDKTGISKLRVEALLRISVPKQILFTH